MDFILRIFFSGLMTFIPSEDGRELTVLLLNADHDHYISDGTVLAHHKPLLLARAGSCSGECPTRDADIAQFIYADQTAETALDSLEAAVSGGGAWTLAGSDLSIAKSGANAPDLPALSIRRDARGTFNGQPSIIPTTSGEREDYSWLADFDQICPTCTLDSAILGNDPPSNRIAARFRLRSGSVFTYAVSRIGSDVTPVHFARLDGSGTPSPYSQAVASWMGAEIAVSGSGIEIVEATFAGGAGGAGRSMTLTPDSNGRVEVAVLNLPPFVPPSSTETSTPQPGKHFEMYYELATNPPAAETRLVPKPGAADSGTSYPQVDWSLIHPQDVLWSDLLNQLRLNVGRGPYDTTLCPPTGGTP